MGEAAFNCEAPLATGINDELLTSIYAMYAY